MDEVSKHPPQPEPHGRSDASRPRRQSAGYTLLFAARRIPKRNWWILGSIVVAVVGTAVALVFWTNFDWQQAIDDAVDLIGGLGPGLLIPAMAVLPLFGFPVLPVYLVAGARFGALQGGLVVALATAVHLIGAYLIARTILRKALERLLQRWHAHLPDIPADEQVAVAFIAALVPGLPYVVRTYLMATIGLRLRIYFWIALPVYVARSYVSILLGELGTNPDRTRLLVIGGVETLKVALCGVVIWWLRQHHRRVHGHPPAHA